MAGVAVEVADVEGGGVVGEGGEDCRGTGEEGVDLTGAAVDAAGGAVEAAGRNKGGKVQGEEKMGVPIISHYRGSKIIFLFAALISI